MNGDERNFGREIEMNMDIKSRKIGNNLGGKYMREKLIMRSKNKKRKKESNRVKTDMETLSKCEMKMERETLGGDDVGMV